MYDKLDMTIIATLSASLATGLSIMINSYRNFLKEEGETMETTETTQMTQRALIIAAIKEREGLEQAFAHNAEKSDDELYNYFSQHYTRFDLDEDEVYIAAFASDLLVKKNICIGDLMREHRTSNLFEILGDEGFLTQINNQWILSITYPFDVYAKTA